MLHQTFSTFPNSFLLVCSPPRTQVKANSGLSCNCSGTCSFDLDREVLHLDILRLIVLDFARHQQSYITGNIIMQQQPQTNRKVKLLTYNVFMRPPGINTYSDDLKDQRLESLKSHINEYDIICFQELFSTGSFRNERLVEFAIKNQFYYWEFCEPPSFFSGSPVDGGLAVLSKYPIIEGKFETYGLGILSDSASDKGSLYCKILINNHVLHLFNTHLQASYNYHEENGEMKKLTIMTRLKQLQMLTKRIDKIITSEKTPEGHLVLIAGDLNADARKIYKGIDFSEFTGFNNKYEINNAEFSQYSLMMEILKNKGQHSVIDHLFQKHAEHPATYGHQEQIFTSPDDVNSQQRLDYILQIIRQSDKQKMHPITSTCQVEKFYVQESKFTHLSDHYGVSIELGFNVN